MYISNAFGQQPPPRFFDDQTNAHIYSSFESVYKCDTPVYNALRLQ